MGKTLVRLAIAQSELFSSWPAEAVSRIVDAAELETVESGAHVIKSGDNLDCVYLLATGSMTLCKDSQTDRSFTVAIHLPGDFHGLGTVMTQSPQTYTAVCKEKTLLIRIPGALLREMVINDGRLAFSLFAAQEVRRRRALSRYETAAVYSTRARIAILLESVSARIRRSGNEQEINLSQEEIANMLGTRRQVVNKILREISSRGAIDLRYGRIVITDAKKLAEIAADRQAGQ